MTISVGDSANEEPNELTLNVMNGCKDEVEKLLKLGADPNCRDPDHSGRTPLHWAAQVGYANIIKALLDAGADVEAQDVYGITPLITAAGEGNCEATKVLIQNGARPNTNMFRGNGNALHLAAAWGHLEIIKILAGIEEVDLNQKDGDGMTPLSYSREGGFTEMTNYLMGKGAR